MTARLSSHETEAFCAGAQLWLQLLALAVGVFHFAFAGRDVERPLLAVATLAFMAASVLLVRILPLFQHPPMRATLAEVLAALIGVTLLAAATGGARSSLLPLYLIPLTTAALAFGRWWSVLMLAVVIAACVAGLGLVTPGVIVPGAEFAVRLFGALAPSAAAAVVLAALIHQVRSASRRIEDLSATDALTGLLNLPTFEETLQKEHRRSERSGRPYTLLVVDVDNLAEVNELLGHEAGSQVLTAVASAIVRSIRHTDLAARLGGDEFVVLLKDADPEMGAALGQRIRNNVYAGTVSVGNRLVRTNVSVGAAHFPKERMPPRELMILADRRMQQDRDLRRPPAA